MSSLLDAKARLRAHVRHRRASLPAAQRSERDLLIQDHARQLAAQRSTVIAFSPLPGEPGGQDLPAVLASTGARVFLPRVVPGRPELEWAEFTGDNLRRGTWGIAEPVGPATPLEDVAAEVLFIPALAVDCSGARLGQGGGYYDRALAQRGDIAVVGCTCALLDAEEWIDSVPSGPHDLRVQRVITHHGHHAIHI